jgi:3-deoxy-manno-octulosonate cytidylyltransferase (CMP-KDO synthetase)
MTSTEHPSGTDRIAEVARRGLTGDLIVNVQGDEPEIEPEVIDGLVDHMVRSGDDMATAATSLAEERAGDSNLVKVIRSLSGHAIYFSRSPIPFYRDRGSNGEKSSGEVGGGYLLHLGLYAYRKEYLLQFAGWAPTPLELAEKLEQLRALEHGSKMYVMRVSRATHGIDTPEQYQAFVQRTRLSPSPLEPVTSGNRSGGGGTTMEH